MSAKEQLIVVQDWTPIKPDKLPKSIKLLIENQTQLEGLDEWTGLEGRILSSVLRSETAPLEQYKLEGGAWRWRILQGAGGGVGVMKEYPAEIVIGNEHFLKQVDIFGRRLMRSDRVPGIFSNRAGRKVDRYRKAIASGQLTFDFDRIPEVAEGNTPSVHSNVRRLYLTMLGFNEKNPVGERGGTATFGEIFNLWGVRKPSAVDYDALQKYFLDLARCAVQYDNKRRGVERETWGFNLIEAWAITSGRLVWNFTEPALSPVTQLWLEGELTPRKLGELGGAVFYPAKYLREPLPQHLDNIRCALLVHRYGRYVSFLTIMRDWAKVKADQFRKPDETVKLCRKWMQELKDRGVIGDYHIKYEWKGGGPLRKGRTYPPPTQVKVKFYKRPRAKATPDLKPGDRKRLDEILEWLTRKNEKGENIHGTTTRPSTIKETLESATARLGMPTVYRAYKEHATGAKPSPPKFWETLYPLGRRGRRSKST